MRRPLFWAAVFLVVVVWIRMKTGGDDPVSPGVTDAQSLGICDALTVSGQVYRKDSDTCYLQDISVCMQTFNESEDPPEGGGSNAGSSRQNLSCTDNIICKLEGTELPLGCRVTLRGRFTPMQSATNPGEFDAAAYYRSLGVGGRLTRAELLAAGEEYWPVRERLYGFRLFLEERLKRALPGEEAGVLCALLLGDRTDLSETTQDLYRQSGILHILSISSLHITILGMSLYRLLRRLGAPVWAAAALGSVFLLLYGALTGFGVSACRAIGMYLIRMLGEILGRTYDMLTALGVMGALMVWKNPYYLQQSGFLLSYASVLGAGVLGPALAASREGERTETPVPGGRGRIRRAGERAGDWLRQSFAASLAVTLTTLPVQLWYYYEAPVCSVWLNLLVLPLVKPLMLSGILLLLFPWASPAAAAAGLILQWYERLCRLCGSMPFSLWNPGRPKIWQIAVYYPALGAIVAAAKKLCQGQRRTGKERETEGRKETEGKKETEEKRKIKGKRETGRGIPGKRAAGCSRKRNRALTAAALVFAVALLGIRTDRGPCVTFLDVGQGDCIVVQTGSGETYLFDCGSSSRSGVGEYVLAPFLKYNGIRTLDAVFVSHPDEDHINGIKELLEMGEKSGISVRRIILPDVADKLKKEQFTELLKAAEEGMGDSVEIRYVCAGDSWKCDNAEFWCLHPAQGWQEEEPNAYSECFYVRFFPDGASLLLTGDVEGEGEKALLEELERQGIGKIDVLKVAHHGSGGATSEELLERLQPELAVISCGRKNRYGHPHPALLERLDKAGSTVIGTAERGAVSVWPEENGIRVRLFVPGG